MFTPKALRQRSLHTLLWLALLILAPRVWAHEFWLLPQPLLSEVAQPVAIELRIGAGWPGTQTPRLPNMVEWFNAHDARGTFPISGADGAPNIGELQPRVDGATLVALRTNPSRITLSADEFNQYLKEEGLNEALALRQRFDLLQSPGREQYSRCAKSIVLVGGNSRGFDALTGLPLELQLLSDPLTTPRHEPVHIQLMLHGQAVAGALIKAQPQHAPEQKITAVSDEHGRVALPLDTPGVWLFSAVHIGPSANDGADWESLWTSLTVEIF